MIICLLVFGLFGISVGIAIRWSVKTNEDLVDHIIATMSLVVLGMAGVLVVIGLVFNPVEVKSDIEEFNSVMNSLIVARENPNISRIELAAIQQKVVEMNQWLANSKFWAKHPLTNWFWPKKIFELQPIK